MLEQLSNAELITKTFTDAGASPEELALAERLQAAIDELERVTQSLQQAQGLVEKLEATDGANA